MSTARSSAVIAHRLGGLIYPSATAAGGGKHPPERGRGMAEMLARSTTQVRLVGESELGCQQREVVLAMSQPVEGARQAYAVPVPGQRDADLAGERPAQPER